jgi:hypothetical protein
MTKTAVRELQQAGAYRCPIPQKQWDCRRQFITTLTRRSRPVPYSWTCSLVWRRRIGARLKEILRETKPGIPLYFAAVARQASTSDTPESRPVQAPEAGRIVAIPEVGGLHHRYERRPLEPPTPGELSPATNSESARFLEGGVSPTRSPPISRPLPTTFDPLLHAILRTTQAGASKNRAVLGRAHKSRLPRMTDAAGAGNRLTVRIMRHSQRKPGATS